MSFQDWCLQNDKQDLLDRWDYELNKYGPDVVSYQSGYSIYFKCPNGKHNSKSVSPYSIAGNGNACQCDECKLETDSFGVWCQVHDPEILERWDYELNAISPFEVLKGSRVKCYFKCPRGLHQSELKTINKITTRGYITCCTYCNSLGQYIFDNFGENSLDIYWDYTKNSRLPFDVSFGADSFKVYIKCIDNPEHPSYPITPSNFVRGRRCPCCKNEQTESKLQKHVRQYITDKYGYNILHEHKCTLLPINPKTSYVLPYDNQVLINQINHLIIEVMGEQHYTITGYVKEEAKRCDRTPQEELEYIQWKDEYKKQYALSQGCYYLAIPYWTEQDESYKQLIDDKIQEILSQTQQNEKP
jgi:hypothetical protein